MIVHSPGNVLKKETTFPLRKGECGSCRALTAQMQSQCTNVIHCHTLAKLKKNSSGLKNLWKAKNVSDESQVFDDNEFHVDGAATAKLHGLAFHSNTTIIIIMRIIIILIIINQ